MATTLRRSDPKLSAVLLRNYSYIPSDGIQECLSGTPLLVDGQEYDISSQAYLTRENFKPLLCCVLNACCQHKFLLADRILTAMHSCFVISPGLYDALVDEEYINNMELIFENICKIKDWDRSVPCVRLLNLCCQTMLRHHKLGNLKRVYRRIIRKICNDIAKYHITIDEKGANTTFELRNLYEAVMLLRTFLLLLLSVGINFYIDVEPFKRSMRDSKTLVLIGIARQRALERSALGTPLSFADNVINGSNAWRKASIFVTFTDPKMMEREVALWEEKNCVVTFSHTSATFLLQEAMELCIELPLISCVDTYEDVESLRFYFDVNLEYLKRTLPKVLSYGFRHEIGRQYRFCVSCQKHSCIRSEIYDEAVTKYQTADIYASIPKQTGIEDTDMTVLGESSTVHSTIMLPKASCAVLELPFMGMTPILSCRSYITSDAGYFSRDSVNMRSLTPGKTAGTPVGKLVDAPFVPPSINRVTTTCTTGSSFQEDDINKCMKNDVIPQRIHQNSLKASIAMIELPREEYSMDEDPQLATINVADTVTSKYEKKNDVGTVTAGVEAINGEAEKVTAIGSTTDERVAEEELAPAAEELVPAETSKVIIKPRAVTLRVKKMRALKRIRQQKSKRASVKGGSPVPDRHYNVRGICSSGLRAVSGDGPCPQSILKHLKRATQLLLKRKKSTCAYVRREFDDIRNAIEARFHLVLCRCQERWNRVNATYTERLNEIMRSVGDDIKLPRLEALVKRLPEPIKLQPAPNVEPGTPALEAIRGGHDHEVTAA